jgi:hypothetical protein
VVLANPTSVPPGRSFPPGEWLRFVALAVLTLKPAGARDVYGGTQGLSDELARQPVIGRIPVHRLMLDLFQSGKPASLRAGSRF